MRWQLFREWIARRAAPWLIPVYVCVRCEEEHPGPHDSLVPLCPGCLLAEHPDLLLRVARQSTRLSDTTSVPEAQASPNPKGTR